MRNFFRSNGSTIVAGLLGAACMSVLWFLMRLMLGFGTPSELFLDRMAPFINVYLFGKLIGLVGGYSELKSIGFLSVVIGQLVVGILGALIYRGVARRKGPRVAAAALAGFGLLMWIFVSGVLQPQLMTQYAGAASPRAIVDNLINLFIGLAIYVAVTLFLLRISARTENHVANRHTSRARFVINALGAAVAVSGGASLVALFRRTSFSYDGKAYIGADVVAITPNAQFYQVTKNVTDPDVNSAVWQLEFSGMVNCPKIMRLADLQAFHATTQEATLSCISNPVGGGLISNAIWKGAPLAAVLAQAMLPKDGRARVLFRAADGYTDTIPLSKALEPTTLIAYEMNAEPLPSTHGFPARMIVPGLFGEKSVKWLTGIELVPESVAGFYEKQGWGPDFGIPIQSRIDVPSVSQRPVSKTPIEIKGVAFGGDRGISQVEISLDGGHSWAPARITYAATMLRWALWSFEWNPRTSGTYNLVVRAAGAHGEPQVAQDRPTAPQGSTGYHRVLATVV